MAPGCAGTITNEAEFRLFAHRLAVLTHRKVTPLCTRVHTHTGLWELFKPDSAMLVKGFRTGLPNICHLGM